MAQRDLIRSERREVLLTVAREAQEWITAHALKR